MSFFSNKIAFLLIMLLILFFTFSGTKASSFYSSKYFGQESALASTQGIGMGGLGIALIDHSGTNFLNPATVVPGGMTRLSAHFISESISMKNEAGSGHSNYLNANGLQLVIPFGDNIALSTGLAPLFIAAYDVREKGGSGTEAFEGLIHGKGSLNKLFMSFFGNIRNKLYLAGSFNYNFGKYDEQWKVTFVNSLYKNTSDINRVNYRGTNFTIGLVYNFTDRLRLGATLTTPMTLDAEANTTFNFRIKNADDEYEWGKTEDNDYTAKLPLAWGTGITYQLKKKWTFGIEYYTQSWENYEVNGHSAANDLKTTHRISMGCQYKHTTDPFERYYKHIPVRFGFYYRNLYFSYQNTNDIIEYAGTIGLGFPFYFYQCRLDLALAVGKRGSLEKNPVEEQIVNFMMTITGGEKWFVRHRKN